MLEGLKIIIDRMETNPDEFVDGDWDYFIEDNLLHPDILFTEDELHALKEAKGKLELFKQERRRRRFTEQVVTHLLNKNNPEPSPEEDPRVRIKLSKIDALRAAQQRKALEAYAKEYKPENVTYTKTITNSGTELTEYTDGRKFINGVLL